MEQLYREIVIGGILGIGIVCSLGISFILAIQKEGKYSFLSLLIGFLLSLLFLDFTHII